MKTTITLSAKQCSKTDYSPQLLFFANGELVDEQIIASDTEAQEYEFDLDFQDGWNSFSVFIGDTGWSADFGPAWELNVLALTVDGSDTFPIDRGEGLKPFMLKFDPSNIVLEVQNSDGILAAPNYVQLCNETIVGDSSFGFAFKVADNQIVDHYFENVESVDAWETLNISRLPFIKFIRLALREEANKIEDYISLGDESTAEKYWRLPVIKKEIPRLESLIDYCAKKPWIRTTIHRNYNGSKLPIEMIIKLLSPVE